MTTQVTYASNTNNLTIWLGKKIITLTRPHIPFPAGAISKSMCEMDRGKTTQKKHRDTPSHRLGFCNNSTRKIIGQTAATKETS